jgi:hypothetical protein
MKASLEKKIRLRKLSEKCSDLLIEIDEKEFPLLQIPTERDKQFISSISEMCSICPGLSDSYVLMYNKIQKEKISEGDKYYKQIRKNI